MANREQLGTNIDSGIVARVGGGLRAGYNALLEAWFPPLNPLPEMVPETQRESVEGRQFDYPVGYNQRTTPRSGEGISFTQMRSLAESYDLLRLVIETRKDQMAKMKWQVKPKDPKAEPDARCDELNAFFAMPDREHTWDDWLRMLLEDLFVLDAPAVYVRPTLGGQVYALEPIDGSTIKRVIDVHGRTPQAPEPAYQQILKGVPAIDYTADELIYKPRNPRTHRVYGYSPVEQIIMSVNIALRRQLHQYQYYTEGSTPDLIMTVPNSWTSEMTMKFQNWWNSMLRGNTAERRGTQFIPDGVKVVNTKENALKDEYDEWLARVICFAFSISPQPFIKEMNRATAETNMQAAMAEGLAPVMNWTKNLMDMVIIKHFGYTDIEFDWVAEDDLDPKVQSEIYGTYIDKKVLTPDEVRIELGKEAMTPEQREAAFPNPLAALDMGVDDGQTGVEGSANSGGANRDMATDDGSAGRPNTEKLLKKKSSRSTVSAGQSSVQKKACANPLHQHSDKLRKM